ncbi:MAG: restriction endonuclease subunit S [bacterium]
MISRRIYCNEYTPLLRELINKVNNSKSKFISPLSDYCYFNPKIEIPQFDDYDSVSFIPMEAVSELTGQVEIITAYYKDVSKGFTKFAEGDLIWAKITPCMQNGKSAIVKGLINGVGFGSTEFHVIRAKNDSINIEFIREILTLEEILNAFQGAFTGSAGQQRVPDDFLAEFRFSIPPRKIQDDYVDKLKIARKNKLLKEKQAEELLNGLNEYILAKLDMVKPTEERIRIFSRKRAETLNSRIDPHFHSPYFIKVFDTINKSKFVKQPLSNLLEDIAGGATPKKGNADLYDSSGIKFLRILNIKLNAIDLEDVKYIQSHVHNGELLRSQLRHDDVVMTITGRVGTAATIEEEILPANINQHLVRLRIKDQTCLPKYLSAYLNTSVGNAMTNKGVSGGTRIAVDYKWIGSLPIPIPPSEIQEAIIYEVESRKSESNRLKTEAETEWQNAKKWFEEELLGCAK